MYGLWPVICAKRRPRRTCVERVVDSLERGRRLRDVAGDVDVLGQLLV